MKVDLSNILPGIIEAEKTLPGILESTVKSAAQPVVDATLDAEKGVLLSAQKQAVQAIAQNNAVEAAVLEQLLVALEGPLLNWRIKL